VAEQGKDPRVSVRVRVCVQIRDIFMHSIKARVRVKDPISNLDTISKHFSFISFFLTLSPHR
jgi:hypothetical protein